MNPPLQIVFCGTPSFAVPVLSKLLQTGAEVKLVVTRPDKPKGRGLDVGVSPVKQFALEQGLTVAQPQAIKSNFEFQESLNAIRPDVIVVVGYGRIIPQWMIDLPPLGNINLHSSLLPKYRGAAPVQWAIASGETTTGVTTMRIDPGLDTGDIFLQRELAIEGTDTAETLSPRLAVIGAELMVETLQQLRTESLVSIPQDGTKATLAPILQKEDGNIDFQRPAKVILDRLRGFQPWPGAYTSFRGKHLVVTKARISDLTGTSNPGMIVLSNQTLLAACNQSFLELLEVQPEGKKRMSARDFLNGYRPLDGERLGLA